MFYIIENDEQFSDFVNYSEAYHFIYPILLDDRIIPVNNSVIGIYVYSTYLSKAFIIALDHNDCTNVSYNLVSDWILSLKRVCTVDAKLLLTYYDINPKIITDLKFQDREIDKISCYNRKWYYTIYENTRSVNKIIPIALHKGYYDQLIKNFDNFDIINTTDYESKALYCFKTIETSGIPFNQEIFKEIYPDHDFSLHTKGNKIYGYYNLYNPTLRPTNKFNNINFLSLNKKNGIRLGIVSNENSILVEFDFKSYHLYMLADEIGFKATENLHTYLGKLYYNVNELTEQQYSECKNTTFKAIYTDDSTYEYIDFISQAKSFKEKLYAKDSEGLDKKEILPYYLQRKETVRNVNIIYHVLKAIEKTDIKLILYTYDSLLFDVPREYASYIETLEDLIVSEEYPVKITYGTKYGAMKEM